ncbi:MAG TPA: 4-hydroxy-3-methylbut-2-enyl diphosphate reductase [Thermodesulforhabdus norvegica]|uniref:4-hydroxy-3-methylbut-2-enyl diphosphate reductase n=1 Tax=Thermodesulforhabdus norvegica TaxID=39841 RepID=A0A7C1AWG0_9BACT|nr:4-hydroxy-3-methylbut-2-enyl diphosphate reductase [Deltaproteobacteria bacterium]MBW2067860.1 4-hydroxy-3-methylbut-2-enyl diphosphate reductase [Deltaproteobacteria bacterium]HDL89931.1 4-hydroxy-3-methylbut-2-enyl diphosphate reductase [Thermodesulforhabdus norvegica]
MEVKVAKTAGFCNGVRYALEMTLRAIREKKDDEVICTYGPLIHNHQVLMMLRERGVEEVRRPEDTRGKVVVIRAHGVPPEVRRALYKNASRVINATCKRVARVQAVIKQHAMKGYFTVIVGDEDHAEVIGLKGYTAGRGVVIHSPEDVEKLPQEWDKVLLVAQTTQNEKIFQEIESRFFKKYPNGVVKKTICGATKERQQEVKSLAACVDAMVIVGGYHSGNTVRLVEVARSTGIPTYHVETENDINTSEMRKYKTVGVSAGASTPQWLIHKVVTTLQSI